MFTADRAHTTVTPTRMHWLDNLRTLMIFLVVLVHAGGVYETSGGWSFFWIVDDPSTNRLTDLLLVIMDIFVMATVFFISGCTTPMSLDKKSAAAFLGARFRRLLLPWLIAVLTLIPLYKIIFLSSRHIPQEHWTTYFHWNAVWTQNWLWFLPVLFLFDLLYALLAKARCTGRNMPLRRAVLATFVIGVVYSICMDLLGLRGWTKTLLLDFQNERLLVYFMMFLLGALSVRQNVFASQPTSKRLYLTVAATAWIPMALYGYLYNRSLSAPGTYVYSAVVDKVLLWLAFHLSLYSILYLGICTFRQYLDRQNAISRMLSANTYYVYILHTIVLGGIAMILLNTGIPSLLKHVVLTVATYTACNLIIQIGRTVIDATLAINRKKVKTMKALTPASLVVALLILSGCAKPENPQEEVLPPHVGLHLAALQGHRDAIQQHIAAGSNLDQKDEHGSSPLIVAVTFGKTEVARALIEAGADMEITNNEGAAPLHIAAFLCHTAIVEILLDHGADKHARNGSGRTALETVVGPFEDVKGIYDHLGSALRPLGFRLDYERLRRTRPQIAEMLR